MQNSPIRRGFKDNESNELVVSGLVGVMAVVTFQLLAFESVEPS